MNQYKYQMHVHTAPCSACGAMSPAELCQALYENGYQGTVLTNHFYHGNSGIDRSESTTWKEFVSAYEKDYLDCLEEAKKYDLDIIFSVEEVLIPGLEILCYGVTPEILYANPELRNCSPKRAVEILRQNGVLIIQPHPFREAFYIPNPGPLPLEFVDGVEVYNRGNGSPEMNQKALDYVNEHPWLIKTSSADAHSTDRVMFGGIITDKRIKSPQELVQILRSGNYQLNIPEEER